jgi:predicted dehydrogenase
MTYRIAVIGCGDMGNTHASAWAQRNDATIASVYDPLQDRCQALAAKTGARACTSAQDAVVGTDIDIVSVCTPVCLHSELACLAMKNGRHVICEKPVALTLEQADLMIACARDNKVKLGVCYQYRGFPKNIKYKELFESGAFGGPVFARFVDVREVRPKTAMHRKSMNGGPIVDVGGHFFDLLRFITGADPTRVYARGHVFGRGKKRLEGFDDLAIDAAEVCVDYCDGHVLTAFIHWGLPENSQGIGSEMLAGPDMVARPAGNQLEARFADRTVLYDLPAGPGGHLLRIADLIAAIEQDREPEVSGPIARTALEVSLAALESIETARHVDLQSRD